MKKPRAFEHYDAPRNNPFIGAIADAYNNGATLLAIDTMFAAARAALVDFVEVNDDDPDKCDTPGSGYVPS